jgi:tetratricopeptide (TPR) repeat protein
LKPNYAVAHQWYAYYLIFNGRPDESLTEIDLALSLDPLSQPVCADKAEILYYTGRFDEALEQYRMALDLNPQYHRVRLHVARVFEQKHMYGEAIEEIEKVLAASGPGTSTLASLARAYALVGRRAEAENLLADLHERSKQEYVSPYDLSLIYAEFGQMDAAFEWLEKAYEQRAEWMIYVAVDPRFDPLRGDRRFIDIIDRVGMPGPKGGG